MLKKLVTLIFIVVGASLGIFAIPELIRLFNLNVPEILKNAYVDGAIGIVVFFILFYWLIDRVVNLIIKGEKSLLTLILWNLSLQRSV